MNYMKTALLLAAMTGLFLAIGFILGGAGGMVIAFVVAVGMNFFAYWNSDRLVLRMNGAQAANESETPDLYARVRRLSQRAGLPMPRVYIVKEAQPNAFATGRNPDNAAVAVTTGLMQVLSSDELDGVLAHELAHIRNRDTLIMTMTAVVAGAISMLANFAFFFGGNRDNPLGIFGVILIMIFAPMAALIVQMAISRTREYAADRAGAEISGSPHGLSQALAKLHASAKRLRNDRAEGNPATAHLFIVNPLAGERMDSLFSTHPATENRIARLNELAGALASQPMAARAQDVQKEPPVRTRKRGSVPRSGRGKSGRSL